MKQILQDLSKGHTSILEAPTPLVAAGTLLIDTRVSLISAGTERMLVSFGKASVLEKARQQPEKVKMVLEKIKTDGLATTFEAIKAKLTHPIPLGYSNVGVISDVGDGVKGFKLGDRVVSNGAHADIVRVPKNLCARIPDNVTDEEACFTVVSSIGLQGVRLLAPTLGESFCVIGAGLIGLITIQLLKAQGCRVLAVDYDEQKLELARQFGADTCNPSSGQDPVEVGLAFSQWRGIDGVIITASTSSSDPISQAATMSRRRGRIILVGVTGTELNRSEFYEKELTFQVSCSYGPGRYDPSYEESGNDYPFGYVRWTEQRNFEAVLEMMSSGLLDVRPLITHRFEFNDAIDAYDILSNDKAALGIILMYSHDVKTRVVPSISLNGSGEVYPGEPVVGFIGAGSYASRMLIPAFRKANANLHSVATSGGVNGVIYGKKEGFKEATTDTDALIANDKVNTIVIVTRHNSHARFVKQSLEAGKHIFVEKPLAITLGEVVELEKAFHEVDYKPLLMVGFNRRFAPHVQKMKRLLDPIKQPKTVVLTINAGLVPASHWTQDIEVGGGRIIGEACHFIDLARFLVGFSITSIQAKSIGDAGGAEITEDKATIIITFEDGSLATIHYFANGANSFPKERVEVFTSGRVLQLDNFRLLKGFGWPNFTKMRLWRQDKGQNACVVAFLKSIKRGGSAPIALDELFEVTRATIEAANQIRK
ncbi:Alcohol dehydrogenase [Pseudidiomarina piscicola]|uniref:Alcohol dehydrogenase n=1 Tax=Pseudidiomarina piscicola TaxID=2614830 RepID=A0A6S6WQE9_9GAMM|nr:bi-domain-containing oxidoreductase [Pseudidiomarina piscicola]CAB0151217.1 Alcohol dehydrogenase [Pseudidiomarina piscicola]VZT40723.1 Alcohol dehydrogenase [Pseudomonas aeruginosa]